MADDPDLAAAVRLLQQRAWFEAHEALERAWRRARGPRRIVLQGLIHLAVSFVHLERGNPRGAVSQWRKARARLAEAPDVFEGVEVGAWRASVDALWTRCGRSDAAARGDATALPDPAAWPVPRARR